MHPSGVIPTGPLAVGLCFVALLSTCFGVPIQSSAAASTKDATALTQYVGILNGSDATASEKYVRRGILSAKGIVDSLATSRQGKSFVLRQVSPEFPQFRKKPSADDDVIQNYRPGAENADEVAAPEKPSLQRVTRVILPPDSALQTPPSTAKSKVRIHSQTIVRMV